MTLEAQRAVPIETKSILSDLKKDADTWFGLRYSMNLYRGCQHGCIYCDSRSACYRMDRLDRIYVKENALEVLERTLASKRVKDTIGFGSMNDPYMPLERQYQMTRRALEIIANYRFPVHIITKSDLVIRDIDLLQRISGVYAAVSVTITTFDDVLCKKLEPFAPVTSKRFEAIRRLSEAGIYCGVTLMPVLPFLNDNEENIVSILEEAAACGAQYVVGYMGMTLREGSREYYYDKLDQLFPGLSDKYRQTFGQKYGINSPDYKHLFTVFYDTCKRLNLQTKMDFYRPKDPSMDYEQLKFDI